MKASLTLLALLAFAGNSILCRLALAGGTIDATSFTAIRLLSGAVVLLCLLQLRERGSLPPHGWTESFLLAGYALPFGYAYRQLGAGTGALLLFGAVQCTMILGAFRSGARLTLLQWLGLAAAFGGLVYLVLPGVSAPPLEGAALMIVAGIAWGLYTLRGRASTVSPLARTAWNFVRASLVGVVVALLYWPDLNYSPRGVLLAIASGGIASGLGYVIWYRVLPSLSTLTASVVQLAVPLIAAAGGTLLIGERLSLRLGVAALLLLGGIGVTLVPPSSANSR